MHALIIPQTLRQKVRKELNQCHPGMVKMKALARNYVCWQGMDADIKRKINCCYTCQSSGTFTTRSPPHPREWPREPRHCIHVDYADDHSRNLLIVTDAHSKWTEVYLTGATNSTTIIEKLRCCFAKHDLSSVLVSYNGQYFTGLECAEFTRKNCIKHKLVNP